MLPNDQRTARLDARLPESVLDLLRRAASIQGRSLSEFVVNSAREAAERAIADHDVISLAVADQQHFAEALLSPPPVSNPLKAAAERHRKQVDSK